MSSKDFNKALANFTVDFAAGDAVRAFTDKGYCAKEIHDKLDFPIPVEKIRKVMWEHLLETNVILLSKPKDGEMQKRVTYEKVQNQYGRTSFKQVVTEDENDKKDYVPCEFGKLLYKDKKSFLEKLEALTESDRNYVLDLPWPLETVWHVKNERITRIMKSLESIE